MNPPPGLLSHKMAPARGCFSRPRLLLPGIPPWTRRRTRHTDTKSGAPPPNDTQYTPEARHQQPPHRPTLGPPRRSGLTETAQRLQLRTDRRAQVPYSRRVRYGNSARFPLLSLRRLRTWNLRYANSATEQELCGQRAQGGANLRHAGGVK